MAQKLDVYTRVTNTIIDYLEKGVRPWHKPWSADHLAENISRPLRHNGLPYNGINIILLWSAAMEMGFGSAQWMTFRQAKQLGGHVRKGAKGSLVVYADRMTKTETDDAGAEQQVEIPFMKGYTVFNVEQIEDLPESYYRTPEPVTSEIERDDRLDAFFNAIGAEVHHGGANAYYAITHDYVQLPFFECFEDSDGYYATLAHELVHWTRHKTRLDRDLGRKKMGDEGYAREELVAELGAAFLCADLAITPEVREGHAAYIENWLTILKNDKRAIFSAAAHAGRAVDFLKHRAEPHRKEAA